MTSKPGIASGDRSRLVPVTDDAQSPLARRRLVGEGRVAEVLEWDASTVLRLTRAPGEREHTERAADAQRAAAAAGVPCPAVHDVIEVDGRWGIVMDRVAGPDQLDAIVRRP